ncbi:uncharacterized protein LOC126551759 [Aphis gossypii]|uniref:uncharacterized protein LOC126551759 n=1 Tax=Aphis gossypii TaxID=80765 RepID=UPI0021590824|nr:uncharacterized protein LOC126551759 [Aphis gossypii]
MESITAFYILLAVTSSWAAVNYDADVKLSVCPPLGLGVNFEVTTIQTRSRMYGCANLEKDAVVSTTPLLNLWLERPVETSVHGHCNDKTKMDHFIFECMSKYEHREGEKVVGKKGWNYIKLADRKPNLNNKNETIRSLFYRCAVYDVHDSAVEGIKIIRMTISEGRTQDKIEIDQCESLSKTMGHDRLPFLPEGTRRWPNGSIYIYMLGRSYFNQANSK